MSEGAIPAGFILPGTRIEVLNPGLPKGPKPFALLDFDGTISLIRQGWQQVMIPMMVDILRQYMGQEETEEDLTALVTEFVTVLTGKQTIYQMMRFEEEIKARGGPVIAVIGAGDAEVAACLALLKKDRYPGWISVEVGGGDPLGEALHGLRFIRDQWRN